MKYRIVLEKSKTGWGAYSPDVPGCVAVGKTREGTLKRMKRAIRFHLSEGEQDEPILNS